MNNIKLILLKGTKVSERQKLLSNPDVAQVIIVYYWATMDTLQRDVIQQHRKPIFAGLTLSILCPRHVTVSAKFQNTANT